MFMPFISWIFGTRDMTALNVVVRAAELNEAGEVTKEAITLGFGTFLATIIDFILVALVVFLIVKAFNAAHAASEKMKKKQEEEAAAPEEPKGPTSEELLAQILEELQKQNR